MPIDLKDFCYLVRGTTSDGGPFYSRKFIGGRNGTLEDARRDATETVSRMNSMGADVTSVKQKLSECRGFWMDAE